MFRRTAMNMEHLVSTLKAEGVLKSRAAEDAMLAVDRKNYCPQYPYVDSPQPIGKGQTISAPHMHAMALECLHAYLRNGCKILDVGSGSGYLTACFAKAVAPNGKAIGIETIPSLVDLSVKNIRHGNPELFEAGVIDLVLGDGQAGFEAEAPYDAIHVGAAAAQVPQKLLEQLKPGGRMVCPVGRQHGIQMFCQFDKGADGTVTRQGLVEVRYVPLV